MIDDPISMEAFEDAIHQWFSNATGLDSHWRRQSSPEPEYPFGSLMILSGPIEASPHWQLETETLPPDPPPPVGSEIKMTTSVPCQFSISCQAKVGGEDANDPARNAPAYLRRAKAALSMESVLALLRVSNISVVRSGPVQNLSALIDDRFVSWSNFDITFATVLSVSEFTGYIEKVKAKSISLGIDQTFGVES